MIKYFEKIYKGNNEEFYDWLGNVLLHEEKTFIVTANPETFIIGKTNPSLNNLLNANETTIVPDGIGVVKAANSLGVPLAERITGVDITAHLFQKANEMSKSIFFYGAKQEVLDRLLIRLNMEYPNILICGAYNGYDNNEDIIMTKVLKKKPDIVLIALGIPKQELLIQEYFSRAETGIFVGVGGSLDVLSGMKKRAPAFFIKRNIEWLYRIMREPKRIGRFYKSNIRFVFEVFKIKKKKTRDGV